MDDTTKKEIARFTEDLKLHRTRLSEINQEITSYEKAVEARRTTASRLEGSIGYLTGRIQELQGPKKPVSPPKGVKLAKPRDKNYKEGKATNK